MRLTAICTVFVLTTIGVAQGAGPSTNDLAVLRHAFDQALGEAQSNYMQRTGDMPAKYVSALDTQEAERRQAGDLEAVVALRQERTRFLASTNVSIENARGESPGLLGIKRQYSRQTALLAGQRDDAIAKAAQVYTNALASLEQQLTRDGRRAEASMVRNETRSVRNHPLVRAAMLGLAAASAETAGRETTSSQPDAAVPSSEDSVPPSAAALDPARLLDEAVVSFQFSGRDLSSPADLLGRLAQRCMARGVRLRVAAPRMNVKSFTVEDGVPKFTLGALRGPSATPALRSGKCTLNAVPLRTVFQILAAAMGLSYRVDQDAKEIVLLDAGDPGATWSPDPLPVDRIPAELATPELRRRHIGRSVLVTVDVTSTIQGVGDLILVLKSGTRMYLPRTAVNQARFEQIRDALNADARQEDESVHVTALASVHPESSAQGLAFGDAVLLEISTGNRHSIPLSSGPPVPPTRSVRRVGD